MMRALLFFIVFAVLNENTWAKPSFAEWIQSIRVQALDKGISEETFDQAFKNIKNPLQSVIALDRNQPELALSFKDYYEKRVPPLIKDGHKNMKRHKKLLKKTHGKYGVHPAILVALWGRETHYGCFTGNMPVIHALATLAYDGRREALFTNELFHALQILEEGHVPYDKFKGSWAGAIGQCQFMPSSFHAYAVDAAEKGKKDIWGTHADIFASSSNFLRHHGWVSGAPCVMEVRAPQSLESHKENLHSMAYWKAKGVQRLNNKLLPKKNWKAAFVRPEKSGRCFLVFENIHAILGWNRSLNFALSIGLLANILNGGDLNAV